MNRTHDFYSRPSYVGGTGFPVYSGSRRQRGGSIFGATLRQVLPDGATVKKAVGKQVLGFVGDVAKDVMRGESAGDALKNCAKERAAGILSKGVKNLSGIAGKAIARQLKKSAPSNQHRPAKRRRFAPPPRRRRQLPPPRRRPKSHRRHVSMQKFRRFSRRGLF